MIEYVSTKNIIDLHVRSGNGIFTNFSTGWNDGLDTALEKKNIVRAVPEEAFETTKQLLKTWRDEARAKKEFAIADQDISTAEIKRSEEHTFDFALQILEKLEKYGEEDSSGEVTCSEN